MTRLLLWEEYKEQHPEGCGYTQFKEYYNRFKKTLNPSMRQIHYAGDKLFVDFSGLTMPIVDALTGEITQAQIFVSVLGASGYTFAYAVMSQSTEDFIACHNRAFAFYGGVPNQIVPDNLKAAVIVHTRKKIVLNEIARLEGSYTKALQKLSRIHLLILDDFGVTPLKADELNDLFEVIEERTLSGSTIITAQLPVKEWHNYLGSATIADAMMDRLIYSAHRIEMKGESMRKVMAEK
jgi:hypothetical protein